MYIYIHTCIHTHIHIYIFMCMCVHIISYILESVYVYICMYVCISIYFCLFQTSFRANAEGSMFRRPSVGERVWCKVAAQPMTKGWHDEMFLRGDFNGPEA